jgi:hypothetical protein
MMRPPPYHYAPLLQMRILGPRLLSLLPRLMASAAGGRGAHHLCGQREVGGLVAGPEAGGEDGDGEVDAGVLPGVLRQELLKRRLILACQRQVRDLRQPATKPLIQNVALPRTQASVTSFLYLSRLDHRHSSLAGTKSQR